MPANGDLQGQIDPIRKVRFDFPGVSAGRRPVPNPGTIIGRILKTIRIGSIGGVEGGRCAVALPVR
jgi:hypothetical protein